MEIRHARRLYVGTTLERGATALLAADVGTLFWDTDLGVLYVWDGAAWDLVGAGGGTPGHVIQDEGIGLAQRANLNFVGAGVTVTDDAINDQSDVTIPGGVDWENVIIVALSGGDFATIAGAIAAAAAGDIILVMPGTYNECTLDIPASVALYGFSRANTVIYCAAGAYAISLANNSELHGVTVNLGGAGKVINVTGSSVYIEGVKVDSSINSTSDIYGIFNDGTPLTVVDCSITTTNAGAGNSYGLWGDDAAETTNVYGGRFVGDQAGTYSNTSHTINLFGTPAVSSAVGPGTTDGMYAFTSSPGWVVDTAPLDVTGTVYAEEVDVQGVADAIVIDSDGDTTISAPTDDQIDIEIGGSDRMVANSTLLTLAQAYELGFQGASGGPTSGIAQTNAVQQLLHIIERGWPSNNYPDTRAADDCEFNNTNQAENNTMGTWAGGDFWEILSGGAYSPPNVAYISTYSTLENAWFVWKTSAAGSLVTVYKGNITSMVTGSTGRGYEVLLLPTYTWGDGGYFAMKLIDSISGWFTRNRIQYGATNQEITVYGTYDNGGGETTGASFVIETPNTSAIAMGMLRMYVNPNAYNRYYFAIEGAPGPRKFPSSGDQYLNQLMGAASSFIPDRLDIEFYAGTGGKGTWAVDSIRLIGS